jgi:REP element-mobilizing transposase RayT
MIAKNHGYQLLATRVHHGDHVHVFVSAKPKVSIPDIVGILKSNSARSFLSFRKIGFSFGVGRKSSPGKK